VVLRAEKGKLRLMVDDEEGGGKREMIYDVSAQEKTKIILLKGRGQMEKTEKPRVERPGWRTRRAGRVRVYGGGEMPGGVIGMDGEAQTGEVCRELG